MIADTNILIWLLTDSRKLSPKLRNELTSRTDDPVFSSISIWEVAIKFRKHADFSVDPIELRSQLLASNWVELPFTGEHAVAVRDLPSIHADPFDRALLAQAIVEGVELVTADKALAGYGAPVRGMV
jgi:PIN domain nuclease of toxin-antitoxin system